MSSDVIARHVKIDDKDNNIEVVIHDDPVTHNPPVQDCARHSVYLVDAFHVRVSLI